MFLVFLIIVYAGFIAWASISSYKKMLYKEETRIHELAKGYFFRIAISGFVGLVSLSILNGYSDKLHFNLNDSSGIVQIVFLGLSVVSVVLFIVFWSNSPSHMLVAQYKIKNQNRQKFEQELEETGFEISKKIECDSEFGFFIDTNKKMLALCNYLYGNKLILNFSEIIHCEIIENNNVVFIGDSKTFNKAKCLNIRIITNDVANAMRTFDLIRNEISKDSQYYKIVMHFAQEVYSAIFSLVAEKNKADLRSHTANEFYTNLERLAALRDKNIITEDEFRLKKEKLLKKI